MRSILRNVLLYAFALYITQMIFSGLVLHGGLQTLIVGGILLTIGFKLLKPILSVISLPFNLLTLGLFSVVIIAFIIFLSNDFIKFFCFFTLIYPPIEIRAFTFPGVVIWGVEIHKFYVTSLLSYILISVTIYLITKLIDWLFK